MKKAQKLTNKTSRVSVPALTSDLCPLSSDNRLEQLKQWLSAQHPARVFELEFAAADADFRCYFRALFSDGTTRIIMDAPPVKMSICPYLDAHRLLSHLHVPTLYAYDIQQGFIELEDFGRMSYLDVLKKTTDKTRRQQLLTEAIDTLIALQTTHLSKPLAPYDQERLLREMGLFQEWYVTKYLNRVLFADEAACLAQAMQLIVANNLKEPCVIVHRDYIVRNLMLTERGPGILDFQDVVYGPLSYDLVSLLRDAFIEFDDEEQDASVHYYWQQAKRVGLSVRQDKEAFYRDFEWMGLQRHLKVAGIFCRLYWRDGKEKYLPEVPRFLNYLTRAARCYPELSAFYQLLLSLSPEDAQ